MIQENFLKIILHQASETCICLHAYTLTGSWNLPLKRLGGGDPQANTVKSLYKLTGSWDTDDPCPEPSDRGSGENTEQGDAYDTSSPGVFSHFK